MEELLRELIDAVKRIEERQEALIKALLEDESEDEMPLTLDGEPAGLARPENTSL
jgi:hypothetical protein